MLNYEQIHHHSEIFKMLTGISVEGFEALFPRFSEAWQEYVYTRYMQRSGRKRRYGGGRKPELRHSKDKLLFILIYFHQYPTQCSLGMLFGIGQAQTHEWIHKLTTVLVTALGRDVQLPERKPKKLEELVSGFAKVLEPFDNGGV